MNFDFDKSKIPMIALAIIGILDSTILTTDILFNSNNWLKVFLF